MGDRFATFLAYLGGKRKAEPVAVNSTPSANAAPVADRPETPRDRMMPDRLHDRIAGASGPEPEKWAEQHFGRPFKFEEGADAATRAAAIKAMAGPLELASESGATLPARVVFRPERGGLTRSLDEKSPFGMFLDQPKTWFARSAAVAGHPANRADSVPSIWVNTDVIKEKPEVAPHLVRHELAHVQHGTIGKAPALGETEKAIAKRVSPYAMTNQREFVAEVYANIASGKRYDEEVMDLYRRFGGPAADRW